MEKVSILLPVYNSETTISRAIESIQNQSYGNFELCIINDGSRDNTKLIIEEICKSDKRISLHTFIRNQGLVSALNFGLDIINSRYIFRMDADDIMLKDRLQTQINTAQKISCGIHSSAVISNNKVRYSGIESDEEIKESLIFMNPISHPTVMFDMNFLPKFSYPQHNCEDYALWCSLALKKVKFHNSRIPTLQYVTSANQKSVLEKNTIPDIASKIAGDYTLKYSFKHSKSLTKVNNLFKKSSKLSLLSLLISHIFQSKFSNYRVNKIFFIRILSGFIK